VPDALIPKYPVGVVSTQETEDAAARQEGLSRKQLARGYKDAAVAQAQGSLLEDTSDDNLWEQANDAAIAHYGADTWKKLPDEAARAAANHIFEQLVYTRDKRKLQVQHQQEELAYAMPPTIAQGITPEQLKQKWWLPSEEQAQALVVGKYALLLFVVGELKLFHLVLGGLDEVGALALLTGPRADEPRLQAGLQRHRYSVHPIFF
jgi:hypothetical protein